MRFGYNKQAYEFHKLPKCYGNAALPKAHGSKDLADREPVNSRCARAAGMADTGFPRAAGLWDFGAKCYIPAMAPDKPAFPAPDHDHGRCAAEGIQHAERL